MTYSKFVEAEGLLESQFRFLSKVKSRKDGFADTYHYYQYRHIHIEPSDKGEGLLGVSTDGQHMHVVDPLDEAATVVYGMTLGYWRIFEKRSSGRICVARLEDSAISGWKKYPDWRKVIPDASPAHTTTFSGFSSCGQNAVDFVNFIRSFPKATAFNIENLKALGVGFLSYPWDVEWYGQEKVVKFTKDDCVALMMPLRMQ